MWPDRFDIKEVKVFYGNKLAVAGLEYGKFVRYVQDMAVKKELLLQRISSYNTDCCAVDRQPYVDAD